MRHEGASDIQVGLWYAAVHHHDDEMGWIRIDNNKITGCCYMKISRQEEIREIFKRHRWSPSTNAMFGIEAPEGRTPFQGGSLYLTSPRAEAPDFAKPTSRLAFRRHLPQHEGRHSFSDGGLGYSVRPLCGRKKTSKLQCQDSFLDDADLLALAYLPMTERRISRDPCA